MSKFLDVGALMKHVSKVTLRGGTVSKLSQVLIVLTICVTFLSWTAQNLWITGGAIFLLVIVCFSSIWRLINFANKNPQAALMEGAQFLIHEQIVLGMKSQPTLPFLTDVEAASPIALPEAEIPKAFEPDSPPADKPQEKQSEEGGSSNG